MTDPAEKRARFRTLHQSGCFVIPNPWDLGSARLLQTMGFAALASTSSGYAWTTGRADRTMAKDEVLRHLTALSSAVDLPINADFESGFAADPEGIWENVLLAIKTGVAGLSIEDNRLDGQGLYDLRASVDRIKAARAAIDASGCDVILVARTEGLLADPAAIHPAIDKLVAFAAAGADCLYATGVKDRNHIAAIVRAVSPKPVNVLMSGPGLTMAQLADLGVRRISVGGALARVAWAAMLAAAEQMQAGSFDGLASAANGKMLNDAFANFDAASLRRA
jgi:2-methylisocitrate lyase-like PEP mutase family enzyme